MIRYILAVTFLLFCIHPGLRAQTTLEEDVAFIMRHAPRAHTLSAEYVTSNCLLAAEARKDALEEYSDEIYREWVLPHTVIQEEVDDWRGEFRERFKPLIAGCTNNYDAAVKLDRTIWDEIGVHYSPKRDKARQSPRHSMRIGMASCTGISIILIDACRALGIPARLVGCCWTPIPGNHSWVEVWSEGAWHVVASGEKEREDNIWFLEYAALADPNRLDTRIYASRYSPSVARTRFWQTWEIPRRISDVPADDVTARYAKKPRLAIVANPAALADRQWREVAEALAKKHSCDAESRIICADEGNLLVALKEFRPRYVAFVLRPCDFDNAVLVSLRRAMRNIDQDPYDDAIWGIVTGPDAATALRIASSRKQELVSSILATTGVDSDAAPGEVAVLCDAYPKGEYWRKDASGAIRRSHTDESMAPAFASFWNEIDPELILTSSHATERNLEMPFSRGNVTIADGRFFADGVMLSPPANEKVWLAAGNCLIANHLDNADMLMCALSYGKVNQFVGYIKETWFGFVGWTTWRYFGGHGYSLAASHYAAQILLERKLATRNWKNDTESAGLAWDLDGTIFYGDPMHRVWLDKTPSHAEDAPEIIIFPESSDKSRLANIPSGDEVFEADDFAIITGKCSVNTDKSANP